MKRIKDKLNNTISLSKEVLEGLAFAEKMGYTKLHLQPPAVTREMMRLAPHNTNPTPVGKVLDLEITSTKIPIRIYIPVGNGPFPTISFFDGGGFVLMSIDTHDELCRQFSSYTKSVVMSVEYRLAPEHPYPAGPEDCYNATRWFRDNASQYAGIGDRMAVAGDSAGGYMALHVAQKFSYEGIELKAPFAAYPVRDHYSGLHQSWETKQLRN